MAPLWRRRLDKAPPWGVCETGPPCGYVVGEMCGCDLPINFDLDASKFKPLSRNLHRLVVFALVVWVKVSEILVWLPVFRPGGSHFGTPDVMGSYFSGRSVWLYAVELRVR